MEIKFNGNVFLAMLLYVILVVNQLSIVLVVTLTLFYITFNVFQLVLFTIILKLLLYLVNNVTPVA